MSFRQLHIPTFLATAVCGGVPVSPLAAAWAGGYLDSIAAVLLVFRDLVGWGCAALMFRDRGLVIRQIKGLMRSLGSESSDLIDLRDVLGARK